MGIINNISSFFDDSLKTINEVWRFFSPTPGVRYTDVFQYELDGKLYAGRILMYENKKAPTGVTGSHTFTPSAIVLAPLSSALPSEVRVAAAIVVDAVYRNEDDFTIKVAPTSISLSQKKSFQNSIFTRDQILALRKLYDGDAYRYYGDKTVGKTEQLQAVRVTKDAVKNSITVSVDYRDGGDGWVYRFSIDQDFIGWLTGTRSVDLSIVKKWFDNVISSTEDVINVCSASEIRAMASDTRDVSRHEFEGYSLVKLSASDALAKVLADDDFKVQIALPKALSNMLPSDGASLCTISHQQANQYGWPCLRVTSNKGSAVYEIIFDRDAEVFFRSKTAHKAVKTSELRGGEIFYIGFAAQQGHNVTSKRISDPTTEFSDFFKIEKNEKGEFFCVPKFTSLRDANVCIPIEKASGEPYESGTTLHETRFRVGSSATPSAVDGEGLLASVVYALTALKAGGYALNEFKKRYSEQLITVASEYLRSESATSSMSTKTISDFLQIEDKGPELSKFITKNGRDPILINSTIVGKDGVVIDAQNADGSYEGPSAMDPKNEDKHVIPTVIILVSVIIAVMLLLELIQRYASSHKRQIVYKYFVRKGGVISPSLSDRYPILLNQDLNFDTELARVSLLQRPGASSSPRGGILTTVGEAITDALAEVLFFVLIGSLKVPSLSRHCIFSRGVIRAADVGYVPVSAIFKFISENTFEESYQLGDLRDSEIPYVDFRSLNPTPMTGILAQNTLRLRTKNGVFYPSYARFLYKDGLRYAVALYGVILNRRTGSSELGWIIIR